MQLVTLCQENTGQVLAPVESLLDRLAHHGPGCKFSVIVCFCAHLVSRCFKMLQVPQSVKTFAVGNEV